MTYLTTNQISFIYVISIITFLFYIVFQLRNPTVEIKRKIEKSKIFKKGYKSNTTRFRIYYFHKFILYVKVVETTKERRSIWIRKPFLMFAPKTKNKYWNILNFYFALNHGKPKG